MNTGAGVCRPRSSGHDADHRAATQLAVCLGHHRRTPFLAAGEEAELFLVIEERVQYWQIALARNAEDTFGTVYEQLIHQDLPACSHRTSHSDKPLRILVDQAEFPGRTKCHDHSSAVRQSHVYG